MLAPDYQTPERMALKERAVPLPDLFGKSVLDVGCDFGHWSFLAARAGAARVVGLDRNRTVKGHGPVNLVACNSATARHDSALHRCSFEKIEIGREWREFGTFDVVLVMSVYHHIFECAGGDHLPIWFWLWRQTSPGGIVLWEGPVGPVDSVVRRNVSRALHRRYNKANILNAAEHYFKAEYIGPALHEATREVWRFTRLEREPVRTGAKIVSGAGGASKAFEYANGRRIGEVAAAFGFRPYPGSLNLRAAAPFDWSIGYYRSHLLDLRKRRAGLDSKWEPQWARFYPVRVNGIDAFAFRFEKERYPSNFVEVIAAQRLRDKLPDSVTLWR